MSHPFLSDSTAFYNKMRAEEVARDAGRFALIVKNTAARLAVYEEYYRIKKEKYPNDHNCDHSCDSNIHFRYKCGYMCTGCHQYTTHMWLHNSRGQLVHDKYAVEEVYEFQHEVFNELNELYKQYNELQAEFLDLTL